MCLDTGFAQSVDVQGEMIDRILLHRFKFIINSCYTIFHATCSAYMAASLNKPETIYISLGFYCDARDVTLPS